MQIILRENPSSKPVTVEVDLRDPPAVIRPQQHPHLPHPVSLNWDRAIDDHLHLRRCPVCGCSDLYARRPVPRVTAFILVLLAAVIAMVLWGLDLAGLAIAALVVVLVIDLTILLLSRKHLVCYRCHTQYRGLRVARGQPGWDAALAEKHQQPKPAPARPEATEAASG